MEKKKLGEIIGIVITVLAVLVGIYLYWQSRKPAEPISPGTITDSATQGTLPSIGEAANPLSSKPDLNPADKANPFDSIKTNPFE